MTGLPVAAANSPAWWTDHVRGAGGVVCAAVNDREALNAALARAAAERYPRVELGPGDFTVPLAPHRKNRSYMVGLMIPDGITLAGAGRTVSTIHQARRSPAQANVLGDKCYLVTPAVMSASRDWGLGDLALDGHSAGQLAEGTGSKPTDKTFQNFGIRAWRATRSRFERLDIRNMRATSGSGGPNETGALDLFEGRDSTVEDCFAYSDDGGDAASGIGFSFGTGNRILHSRAERLIHGFPAWGGTANMRIDCVARDCRASGFRHEFDVDAVDALCRAERCGTGGTGHGGFALLQSQRTRLVDNSTDNPDGGGVSVNQALEFIIEAGDYRGRLPGLHVIDQAKVGMRPGHAVLTRGSKGWASETARFSSVRLAGDSAKVPASAFGID